MQNEYGINGAVVIRLLGGLGNQMFQYVGALGLAVRQGKALRLDVSAFEAYKTWPYQLDCLKPDSVSTSRSGLSASF